MSEDSQMDEGGIWEENSSPNVASDGSPEVSEEDPDKARRHLMSPKNPQLRKRWALRSWIR